MAKERIGDTNNFRPRGISKPPRIGDRRENIRFSFEIPSDGLRPPQDCVVQHSDGKIEVKPELKSGRSQGEVVLYDGDQINNYKLNYPRFDKGINLIPTGISRLEDGTVSYDFCSKRSSDDRWTASIKKIVILDGTFIDAGGPLYIICPRPYRIETVTSDGSAFKWTKLPGGRPAQVVPDNVIDPELVIFDAPGVIEPIQFKVEVKDNPALFDILTIYTQPIDFIGNLSFSSTSSRELLCRQVPCSLSPNQFKVAPLPLPAPRAYCFSPSSVLPIAWSLPTCDLNLLQSMVWQANTTGAYVDFASFAPTATRLINLSPLTHYRVKSIFAEVTGALSESYSCTFYLQPSEVGFGVGIVGGDRAGNFQFASLSSYERLAFAVLSREGSDRISHLAYNSRNDFERLSLGAIAREVTTDKIGNLSFNALNSYGRLNLGGVIIG